MRTHWIVLLSAAVAIVVVALAAPEWGYNVLLSLDQHVNAIFGGDPDETISSRMGKWLTDDPARRTVSSVVCAFLDLFEGDHCIKSIDMNTGGKAVIR